MTRILVGFACLAVFMGIPGCGRSLPPTAPVSGSVMLNDKPLTKGMVHFIPDNSKGTAGRMAVATIESDGRFSGASCFQKNDGALVGFHKIVIDVPTFQDLPEPGEAPKTVRTPQPPVPVRYSNPATTDLTAEVTAGGNNTFEFRLRSP